MQLTISLYNFRSDGTVVLVAELPHPSIRFNSAVLRAESALYEPANRKANGFIICDEKGDEVARWKTGDRSIKGD